ASASRRWATCRRQPQQRLRRSPPFRHRGRDSHPQLHRRHALRELPARRTGPLCRRRPASRYSRRPRGSRPHLSGRQRRNRWSRTVSTALSQTATPTIGVFDSGFGGLTVLRELLPLIPGAHYIYLGDTARLPYGSKSQATIARYAVESARFLESRGAHQLVIACNTASALAMPEIAAAVRIPVAGVIEPVVRATHLRSPTADTVILATSATVQSHAYRDTCSALGLRPTEKACPLLVPLIEEGWIDHPVTRDVLGIYLREALDVCSPKVVILGC